MIDVLDSPPTVFIAGTRDERAVASAATILSGEESG